MTALYQWIAEASAWWWPRFADHLWQTTLFALIVLAATFVLRRGPAHWRHTFCLLASVKFLAPAALFVLLAEQTGIASILRAFLKTDQNSFGLSGMTEPVAALASTYVVTVAANSGSHNQIYFALTTVWLTGSVTLLLLWGIRRHKFLRSLSLSETSHNGREWQALERARNTLQWQGRVGLVISPLKLEPAVWRVWRPTVVLPDSIASHLNDDELEAIMLHELIHIQRRDNLIGNLQLGLCALLWFHPLVWFISRKLFDEREQACDERVIEVCRLPEAYASSILKVVRFCFGWRVAGVTGAASGSNLRRRIENIMTSRNRKRRAGVTSRVLAVALVTLALLVLVAAGVYSRPRVISSITRETVAVRSTDGSNSIALPSESANNQKASKGHEGPPPTPPTPPAQPAASAQPPQTPQPAQPTQAAQPAQPAQPAEPAEPGEQDKDSDKEKSWKVNKEKIKKGELIEAPRPAYPDEIKEQKIEGVVVVVITIGNDGNVIYAKAKSGPEALYTVSEAAARKARFKPTMLDGQPVKVTGLMTYDFVLDEN
jgi:TonB family protein